MRFTKSNNQGKFPDQNSLFLIFYQSQILLSKNLEPFYNNIDPEILGKHPTIYLGQYNGSDIFTLKLHSNEEYSFPNFHFSEFLMLYDQIDSDLFEIISYAYQLNNWNLISNYCGKCGKNLNWMKNETAKICHSCKETFYPKISPAVIVAVIKDQEILLGSAKNFRTNFYSVLAGFVEIGETLEECAQREIYEETGIRIKNIKYFGSQSWALTNSLMVGFTAEYQEGEIQIDTNELLDAKWFKAQDLHKIPSKVSIARSLIDWFVKNHS